MSRLVVVQLWLDGTTTLHQNEERRIRYIEYDSRSMMAHTPTESYVGVVDETTWREVQRKGTCFALKAPPKEGT